jgi:hypothetical protein
LPTKQSANYQGIASSACGGTRNDNDSLLSVGLQTNRARKKWKQKRNPNVYKYQGEEQNEKM